MYSPGAARLAATAAACLWRRRPVLTAQTRVHAAPTRLATTCPTVRAASTSPPPPPGASSAVTVVGIAGGSGSGKTVFCENLRMLLKQAGTEVVVMPHDMYYKNCDVVINELGSNWDCPEALLTGELAGHIEALQAGEQAVLPRYDFTTSTRVVHGGSDRIMSVQPGGVVLVEGSMVLESARLRNLMHLKIFVDCDEDVRFMRRLARDTDPHGAGGRGRSASSVYKAWETVVKPSHHQHVEPSKRFAHVVVPSTKVYASPLHLQVEDGNTSSRSRSSSRSRVDGGGGSINNSGSSSSSFKEALSEATAAETDELNEMWPALHMLCAFLSSDKKIKKEMKS